MKLKEKKKSLQKYELKLKDYESVEEVKVIKVRDENILGRTATPSLIDIKGNHYITVDMSAEEVKKLPKGVKIIWRSDDLDKEGNQKPWPVLEVQAFNEAGKPDGTRKQEAPRIGGAV